MVHYLDTSALTKLVVAEAESKALRAWLTTDREPVACDLARTELIRAVRRSAPDRLLHARAVLDSLTLIDVTTSIFEQASRLDPPALRSLDAIHLATAQVLTNESGTTLVAFVTYDRRLLECAKAAGLPTASPGQN